MRKLKKELVWGIVGRYNMCASNATFHSTLEMCLNCGVFIGLAAEMQAPAAMCVTRSKATHDTGNTSDALHFIVKTLNASESGHIEINTSLTP